MENEAVKTPHLQGLAGTVLERLIQFLYTLILDETLSTSDELGTVKPLHQHFSLGQFVPKLRPLGRRQCAVRRVWGGSPTSVFCSPSGYKK